MNYKVYQLIKLNNNLYYLCLIKLLVSSIKYIFNFRAGQTATRYSGSGIVKEYQKSQSMAIGRRQQLNPFAQITIQLLVIIPVCCGFEWAADCEIRTWLLNHSFRSIASTDMFCTNNPWVNESNVHIHDHITLIGKKV